MLPGKTYRPEDYLRMAWARRWVLVVPAVLIGTAVFVWSSRLPDRYRAEATILVVPQRVPESYVRSTVTAQVQERLQVISQQILSRTQLERILEEFNLYPVERTTMIMEDLVQRMRDDIDIAIARPQRRRDDANSFTIGFESADPRTAMLVANRLASLFVQGNLENRALLADATDEFLRTQLEDARRRLVEQEEKLEAFRRRYSGRLPSQVQSNLQLMQGAQNRLVAVTDAAARDRERLAAIEATLADLVELSPPLEAPPPGAAAQRLAEARAALRALELRLTPAHPDVQSARRTIAELEARAEVDALQAPVVPLPGLGGGAAPRPPSRRAALETEAADVRRRLDALQQEETRLRAATAEYSRRLEASPGIESEQTELMRDYGTLQDTYSSLLRKSEDARLAVSLERRQIGEQFRMLEGARLPERPFSPDRQRLNLLGLAAGLALGVALAALLEYRDTTLKTDEDVVLTLGLPVLAVVPAMFTARERRRMRRLRLALAGAGAALTTGAALAWRLGLLDQWLA